MIAMQGVKDCNLELCYLEEMQWVSLTMHL